MVIGNLTLAEIDLAYQQALGFELLVFPLYENDRGVARLAGLITGTIGQRSVTFAFLEHIMVFASASHRVRALFELPKACLRALAARGIDRAVMCLELDHARYRALTAWARRIGFIYYATRDNRQWFSIATRSV